MLSGTLNSVTDHIPTAANVTEYEIKKNGKFAHKFIRNKKKPIV